jgi:hypothetical protein
VILRNTQPDGGCVLHCFLQVLGSLKLIREQWWIMCGGSVSECKLRGDIEGLIRFYVFKLRCDIICNSGWSRVAFSPDGHDYVDF